MYRHNHVQGRNTIQDVSGSIKYRVIRCLDEVGKVYAIRPQYEMHIHCTELRMVPVESASVTIGPERTLAVSDHESLSEGRRLGECSGGCVFPPTGAHSAELSTKYGHTLPSGPLMSEGPEPQHLASMFSSETRVRRTTWEMAGQHFNIHHVPRFCVKPRVEGIRRTAAHPMVGLETHDKLRGNGNKLMYWGVSPGRYPFKEGWIHVPVSFK